MAREFVYSNGDRDFPKAANVPVAAGAAPTKAEFDALIAALIAAGLMASAED